jgi:hypothetical protein
MWTTESPGIEIAHAHSADEFIYILRRSNSCWWEGGHAVGLSGPF